MPRLSIIIATYNSARDIERCLRSITDNAPTVEHEIVVFDNNSADDTVARARAMGGAIVVASHDNRGFAAANNAAIRLTSSELLLLLNPDTIVGAGAIDALVQTLDARPDVAACGPRLVDTDGRAELSFGSMMGPFSELRQKLLVVGHRARWPLIDWHVERTTRTAHEPDWVSGACLCVRRSDAEAVGLFDERYFLYAEDVDFCAALRMRGRRILFVPGAVVVHARGQSRVSASTASQRAYRASQLAFYAKHHPAWAPVLRAYLRLRGQHP